MKYKRFIKDYIVYENGDIFSEKRNKFISKRIHKNGYLYCEPYINNKKGRYYIHQIVAKSFIPNPESKPQINHKDGNKINNHVLNLEWVTCQENIIHAHKLGIGGKPKFKKIIQKKDGQTIHKWNSIKDAVLFLDISYSNLSNCLTGRAQTAGGFQWEYDSN